MLVTICAPGLRDWMAWHVGEGCVVSDRLSVAWPASAATPFESLSAHTPPRLRAPALQAGWTALKKAALNGHELAVDTLLDAGAHPNVPGADEVGASWTGVLDVL